MSERDVSLLLLSAQCPVTFSFISTPLSQVVVVIISFTGAMLIMSLLIATFQVRVLSRVEFI